MNSSLENCSISASTSVKPCVPSWLRRVICQQLSFFLFFLFLFSFFFCRAATMKQSKVYTYIQTHTHKIYRRHSWKKPWGIILLLPSQGIISFGSVLDCSKKWPLRWMLCEDQKWKDTHRLCKSKRESVHSTPKESRYLKNIATESRNEWI